MRNVRKFGLVLALVGVVFIITAIGGATAQAYVLACNCGGGGGGGGSSSGSGGGGTVNVYAPTEITDAYVCSTNPCTSTSETVTLSPSATNYLGFGTWYFNYQYNLQNGLTYGDDSVPTGLNVYGAISSGSATGYAVSPGAVSASVGQPYVETMEICDSLNSCGLQTYTLEYVGAAAISYQAFAIVNGQQFLIYCGPSQCTNAASTVSMTSTSTLSFEIVVAPGDTSLVNSIGASCAAGSGGKCPFSSSSFSQSSTNSSLWTLSVSSLPAGSYTFTGTLNAANGGGSVQSFMFSGGANVSSSSFNLSSIKLSTLDIALLVVGVFFEIPGLGLLLRKGSARGR